jgi:transcriptional regulator with XRE-family HTH domain
MLEAAQIRAARGLLGWRQVDLAEKSGIGLATLRRLEQSPDGRPVMAHVSTVMRILECLEKSGIVFVPRGSEGGVGVRFANKI